MAGSTVPPYMPVGEQDPLLGALVGGKFRILRPLGVGGMGAVYLAVQEDVAREVVVKVMRAGLAQDPTALERFKREARSLGQISHPNVVHVHDFGPHADTYFLAMEYVRGYDLSSLLKHGGQMDPRRSIRIVSQVLAALDVTHGQGVIHRDLKPGNIRITSNPNEPDFVKVLDFGLIKSHSKVIGSEPLTQAGRVVGTPAYMSPEQVVGGDVDARSDLYSVGVIFYQMLTGSHPFSASTPTGYMRRHYHDRPEGPSDRMRAKLHPRLESFLMRLLAKQRQDRPESALAALRELAEIETLMGSEDGEPRTPAKEVPSAAKGWTGGKAAKPLGPAPKSASMGMAGESTQAAFEPAPMEKPSDWGWLLWVVLGVGAVGGAAALYYLLR